MLFPFNHANKPSIHPPTTILYIATHQSLTHCIESPAKVQPTTTGESPQWSHWLYPGHMWNVQCCSCCHVISWIQPHYCVMASAAHVKVFFLGPSIKQQINRRLFIRTTINEITSLLLSAYRYLELGLSTTKLLFLPFTNIVRAAFLIAFVHWEMLNQRKHKGCHYCLLNAYVS